MSTRAVSRFVADNDVVGFHRNRQRFHRLTNGSATTINQFPAIQVEADVPTCGAKLIRSFVVFDRNVAVVVMISPHRDHLPCVRHPKEENVTDNLVRVPCPSVAVRRKDWELSWGTITWKRRSLGDCDPTRLRTGHCRRGEKEESCCKQRHERRTEYQNGRCRFDARLQVALLANGRSSRYANRPAIGSPWKTWCGRSVSSFQATVSGRPSEW